MRQSSPGSELIANVTPQPRPVMIFSSGQFRSEIGLPAPPLALGFPEQFSIVPIFLPRSWHARTALLSLEKMSEDFDRWVALAGAPYHTLYSEGSSRLFSGVRQGR